MRVFDSCNTADKQGSACADQVPRLGPGERQQTARSSTGTEVALRAAALTVPAVAATAAAANATPGFFSFFFFVELRSVEETNGKERERVRERK